PTMVIPTPRMIATIWRADMAGSLVSRCATRGPEVMRPSSPTPCSPVGILLHNQITGCWNIHNTSFAVLGDMRAAVGRRRPSTEGPALPIYEDATKLAGRTPLVRINRIIDSEATVAA